MAIWDNSSWKFINFTFFFNAPIPGKTITYSIPGRQNSKVGSGLQICLGACHLLLGLSAAKHHAKYVTFGECMVAWHDIIEVVFDGCACVCVCVVVGLWWESISERVYLECTCCCKWLACWPLYQCPPPSPMLKVHKTLLMSWSLYLFPSQPNYMNNWVVGIKL